MLPTPMCHSDLIMLKEGISYTIMIAINLITLYSGTLLLTGMSQHNYFMYTIISSALRDYIAGAAQKCQL